ncbi:hypothetical protein GCM10025868_40060 [Angustibacter aerolatus]|uniref:3-dehydroquinate dehydratase n=1 Tax=Angustibacter aerolatus TaxID=1162965 RepID=A0ABQ6JMI2_9ACTN|nr:hypothetical protein GCM10025868_40060 [Angustibacter aerolatus]
MTLCVEAGAAVGAEVEVRQSDAEHEPHRVGARGDRRRHAGGAEPRRPDPHQRGAARRVRRAHRAPGRACTSATCTPGRSSGGTAYVSPVATAVMAGFGVQGYPLAIRWLAERA